MAGPQVDPGHYRFEEYVHEGRWASYWHQIANVLEYEPASVLEVGVGAGVFGAVLRQLGTSVTTVDLDARLRRSCAATVRELPFADRSFSVAACFRVLEHLPFVEFEPAVRELLRVSNKGVVLSLPDRTRTLRFAAHVPRRGMFRWMVELPRLKALRPEYDGQHYWEVGWEGYPLEAVTARIREAGAQTVASYRVSDWPFHRFLVLAKPAGS